MIGVYHSVNIIGQVAATIETIFLQYRYKSGDININNYVEFLMYFFSQCHIEFIFFTKKIN